MRRVEQLGLPATRTDRLLPVLVGAMSFLAALALAGALAAAALAAHWQGQTDAALTVQVPSPDDPAAGGTRRQAVLAALSAAPGLSDVHLLTPSEVNDLLKPWLGADAATLAIPLPALITATWRGAGPPDALAAAVATAAPGASVQTGARWAARIAALTASIQTCAAAILCVVVLVAAAMVAVATRASLAQRRDVIEIIHGLGALDADVAAGFSGRATLLAALGGAAGALAALPVLLWLAALAAPFAGARDGAGAPLLPAALWGALPALPCGAALIGWGTTQATVRGWLRRLA